MARARVTVARKLAVILHRMWSDGAELRFGNEIWRRPPGRLNRSRRIEHKNAPERANRIVPVGPMGEAISLRVLILRRKSARS